MVPRRGNDGCKGLVIFLMRFWIPESPRWLITHGQSRRAAATIAEIEERCPPPGGDAKRAIRTTVRLRTRSHTPLAEVVRTSLQTYPQRAAVGLSLMASQAFFYNAIFFTYALILTEAAPSHVLATVHDFARVVARKIRPRSP